MPTTHFRRLSLLSMSALLLAACGQGEPTTEPEARLESDTSMELADWAEGNESFACEFSHEMAPNEVSTGRMYVDVAGDRLFIETQVESAEQTEDSFMLREGNTQYIWATNQPQGMQMALESDDLFVDMDLSVFSARNEQASMTCEEWDVDAAVFALPEDVEFIDLQDQMDQLMQQSCSQCDELEDPAEQEQCRQALGCQ